MTCWFEGRSDAAGETSAESPIIITAGKSRQQASRSLNLLDSASHKSCNLIDTASSLRPEDSHDCKLYLIALHAYQSKKERRQVLMSVETDPGSSPSSANCWLQPLRTPAVSIQRLSNLPLFITIMHMAPTPAQKMERARR